MWHEIDGTANPVTVTTYGRNNERVAVTTWPDVPSALAYAERITSMLGSEVREAAAS